MDLRLKNGHFRLGAGPFARIAVNGLSCFACGSYMVERTPEAKKYVRTLLVLGRVSNLPTVWSNCVAGWLSSGGGSIAALVLLCGGATALYIGGVCLSD